MLLPSREIEALSSAADTYLLFKARPFACSSNCRLTIHTGHFLTQEHESRFPYHSNHSVTAGCINSISISTNFLIHQSYPKVAAIAFHACLHGIVDLFMGKPTHLLADICFRTSNLLLEHSYLQKFSQFQNITIKCYSEMV